PSRHLSRAGIRRGRRPDELRHQPGRCLSSGRSFYRPHPQGRQARRPAGGAGEQVRIRHQPADRAHARHRSAAGPALDRRRGDRVRRREFIALLGGGAAAAWPRAARAQQAAMPVIAVHHLGSPEANVSVMAAFRRGLAETGYIEGRNVAIEFRWAHNDPSRLPELAADLVRDRVAVIATPGSVVSTLAAKTATTTIPIVFNTGADPVEVGLVTSLNKPGGNLTGVSYMNTELAAKRLGMLHELLPKAARFALLVERNNPSNDAVLADLRAAAASIGRDIEVVAAGTGSDIIPAFTNLVQ